MGESSVSKAGEALRLWLAPAIGMTLAIFFLVVGFIGLVFKSNPVGVPNLFVGVTGLGILSFLLMIPILDNSLKKSGNRNAKNEVEEVQPFSPAAWSQSGAEICQILNVYEGQGLSFTEAEQRLEQYGPNEASKVDMPGYFSFFVKEIYEFPQLLLLCVGILYLTFGSLEEAITAFLVILLMAFAEVGTEWRAKRALSSLEHSSPPEATVRRNGQNVKMDARHLVPGDIVILKTGMEVPADLRLLRSHFLSLNESKLTGETTPVAKYASELLPVKTSQIDRTNIALAGSLVSQGRGMGVVFQTGPATNLGQLLALTRKDKEKKTKLQKLMKELSLGLSIVALGSSVVGALLGLLKHMRWQDVIISGLSLAFATIPEELPILIAAVLAVGARTLSLRFMYVKKLRAAENLGFIDTILTDKTGTLTENRLLLHSAHIGLAQYELRSRVSPMEKELDSVGLEKLLEAWLFMSDVGSDQEATQSARKDSEVEKEVDGDFSTITLHSSDSKEPEDKVVAYDGDMFDQAILYALGSPVSFSGICPVSGILSSRTDIKRHLEKVYISKTQGTLTTEVPFDPTVKLESRTFTMDKIFAGHLNRNGADSTQLSSEVQVIYVKGAPELLLRHCSSALVDGNVVPIVEVQSQLEAEVARAASNGHRLIGYACQEPSDPYSKENIKAGKAKEPYAVLGGAVFLGYFSFEDPVREGAATSVEQCQQAGVRVIMVTGDHLATAISVAQNVGILSSEKDLALDMAVSCTDKQLSTLGVDQVRQLVLNTRVFARATPGDKLMILEALQGCAKCVMSTGDGMNDAPILAKADVGVAMGKGTDVARDAASIVMMDDNFSMIPVSLEEGRRLLDNLRKALAFYLGAKMGLIFLFILGTLWQKYPLTAIQIILLELFMDLGASTSFVMEPADSNVMARNPRHTTARFFDGELISGILVAALSMATTVFISFGYAIVNNSDSAQTSAFLTWLLTQVFMAFNLRTFRQPVIFKGFFSNMGMVIWLVSTIALLCLILASGFVRSHLTLTALPISQCLLILLVSVIGTFWIETLKIILSLLKGGKSAQCGSEDKQGKVEEMGRLLVDEATLGEV